jgi:hypothetical protein
MATTTRGHADLTRPLLPQSELASQAVVLARAGSAAGRYRLLPVSRLRSAQHLALVGSYMLAEAPIVSVTGTVRFGTQLDYVYRDEGRGRLLIGRGIAPRNLNKISWRVFSFSTARSSARPRLRHSGG